MLNYMQAEIMRSLKRKYLWVVVACLLFAALLGCFTFIWINQRGINSQTLTTEHFMDIGGALLAASTYLLGLFVDMITIEEYKNNTIKNIASSGLSRVKIYLSKNIVVILLALLAFTIILCGSVTMSYFILGIQSALSMMNGMKVLLFKFVCSIFIWAGALSMLHCIANFLKSGMAVSLLYVALLLLLGKVLSIMGHYISPIFNMINSVWIATQMGVISGVYEYDVNVLWQSMAIGLGYVVICGSLGSYFFRKMDL